MTDIQPPALVSVYNVEIADVGFWDISNAKNWHPTADDLAAAVKAQECPAVRRPCLKFGHTGIGGEGDPALGSLDNLRVSDNGQTLIADFIGVPAWLAQADKNGNSVLASAYPDRSGEFVHDYKCQLGHTHPFVVQAMALLGVVPPGIGTLESLLDTYSKAPKKTPVAASVKAGVTADKLRKAYYSTEPAASDFNLWIREVYVDPPELIVQDDNADSLLRVPYAVSGDSVTFSKAQPVEVAYVAARAKLVGTRLVAFASKSQARPQRANPEPTLAQRLTVRAAASRRRARRAQSIISTLEGK